MSIHKKYYSSASSDIGELIFDISNKLRQALTTHDSIVFLSIGSDRSTGDSLGPLVGQKLLRLKNRFIHVFGSLEEPIHAKNLDHCLSIIPWLSNNPYVVAIDACLGNIDRVGSVILTDGPLFPGSGVKKNLPPAGDISLAGIVNHSGEMDFFTLQNTRLHRVVNLANFISDAIIASVEEVSNEQKACNRNLAQL